MVQIRSPRCFIVRHAPEHIIQAEVFELLFTEPLKQNHVFRKLYARGKSAVGPYLVVYAMRNGLKENRLGVTASTKLGHAVVRNKARRRLRECYRLHEGQLKCGYDVILVARSRCVTVEFARLEKAFVKQCAELRLLKAAGSSPSERREESGDSSAQRAQNDTNGGQTQ